MAINNSDCKLLFYSKKLGVSFDEVLMLGRLNLYASKAIIAESINLYKTNVKELSEVKFLDEYSEPLFEILGARKIDSMDSSNYENASIIHDLNIPIPEKLKNSYSLVVDGGTIEHVFNFPVAIKNCMESLKVGGHYIGITPANNQMGHGFYQFSPELYYRVFSEENGFRVKKMLINLSVNSESHWYEVKDPKKVNSRVMLVNNSAVVLIVIAEKTKEALIFNTIPQQSDYVNAWNAHTSIIENKIMVDESKFKYLYRKLLPRRLKTLLRYIYNVIFSKKATDSVIGSFNPNHFIKTTI